MMFISKAESVQTTGKPKMEDKKSVPFKKVIRRHPTLKKLQEKNIHSLTQICQECQMIFWKNRSFNFQSQKDMKKLGG